MANETCITRSILLAVWRGDQYGRTVLTEETLAVWPPQGYLWRKDGRDTSYGQTSEPGGQGKKQ